MGLHALPIELNQQIAVNIESDKDFCAFTSVCRQTYAAVLTPGVWRKRFARHYDLSLGQSNRELQYSYQMRARILVQGTIFKDGHGRKESRCLEFIKDMMLESFDTASTVPLEADCSHNIEQLRQMVLRTNLLHDVFRNGYHELMTSKLLLVLQLALTHWSLDLKLQVPTLSWEVSQKWVYQPINEAPVFIGSSNLFINTEWLLHVANFFKYHLTRQDQFTLHDEYLDLANHEKPRAWKGKIESGVKKLGRSWKGIHAYLDNKELSWIRRTPPGRKIIIDTFEEPAIQDIDIDFGAHVDSIPWPEAFDIHLHSKSRRLFLDQHKNPITAESLRFEASGLDSPDYSASGYVQELPSQQGIPGWKRFTMMKYCIDENGFYMEDHLWAYEGCVLPGGQIILGRWWAAQVDPADDEFAYSGPFIFWNTSDDDTKDFDNDSGFGGSPN